MSPPAEHDDAMPPFASDLAPRFEVLAVFEGGEGWTAKVRPRAGAACEQGADSRPLLLKVVTERRLSAEASLLTSLDHPAVPCVHEVGATASGAVFSVRDFVDGVPLSEAVPLAPDAVLRFAYDALEALAYVHRRGVLHLDLKPANIVHCPGHRPCCALVDFGFGARAEAGTRSRAGTPVFASPEQLLGLMADARSDLFGLGVVLYVALFGASAVPLPRFLERFPEVDFFEACGVRPADLPAPFDRVLPRLVARRPDRRFADAEDALEALGGAKGRPRLHTLRPDPLRVFAEAIARAAARAGDGEGVRVSGSSDADRRAVAVHLACSLGGVRSCARDGESWSLVRDGGAGSTVELTLPDMAVADLGQHLERAVALEVESAAHAARWLLDSTPRQTGAVGDALVELARRGEIVPHGLGWLWPDADVGRLELGDRAGTPSVALVETMVAAAERGHVDRARYLLDELCAAAPDRENELGRAFARALLRSGEAARALPHCAAPDALRARALLDMGRVEEAASIPIELRPGPLSDVEVRRLRGQICHAAGDREAALAQMQRLLEESDDPEDQAVAIPILAEQGAMADGIPRLGAAMEALEQRGQPYAAAVAANNLAVQHRARGQLDRAGDLYRHARELFFALGHGRAAATAALNLGILSKDRGDHATAVAELRRAQTLFAELGDEAGQALALGGLGSVAISVEDWAGADARLREAVSRLQTLGAREHLPLLRAFLALARAHLGDGPGARAERSALGGDVVSPRVAEILARVDRVLLEGTAPRPDSGETSDASTPGDDPMSPQGISRERFRTFVSVNRRLAVEVNLEEALRYATECAVSMTGGRRGYVLLQRDGQLSLECEAGEEGGKRAFSRTMANRAIQERRTLTEADVVGAPGLLDMPSVQELQVRSAVCAPFESAMGAKGALFVEHGGRSGVFGEADKEDLEILADQVAIAVDRLLNAEALRSELQHSRSELALVRRETGRRKRARMVGKSPAIEAMQREIHRLSESDLSVLIVGETGSGKELVARALHDQGHRAKGPFVSENCSALPPELMEAELFGHEKGAFTGAEESRPGLLELANGGTLFLDEVGDMPPALQAKLLRALQEQSVRRVGGGEQIAVDLRVLSATHKNLRQMVQDGEFREDLFYRLAAIELRVPALRERGTDVVLLAHHFLERLNAEHAASKRFGAGVEAQLTAYPWPGNVRELEHVLARAFLLADGAEIRDLQLPEAVPPTAHVGADPAAGTDPLASVDGPVLTLKEVERLAIDRALRATGGDKSKAARLLGISRTAIYDKLKRLSDES